MFGLFWHLCYSIHGGSRNQHQDLFQSRPVLVTALSNRLCIHQRHRPLLYTKRQKLNSIEMHLLQSTDNQDFQFPLQNPEVRYVFNTYPTAFPYGNGMVLHFYQQQESSTTKTVHKVINKGLKTYV